MKKNILLLLFLVSCVTLFAQNHKIETNIFGDLVYESTDGRYTATMKKNIFDDLIFTDNRNNAITYEKKYLAKEWAGILGNKQKQTDLLLDLIRQNRRSEGYVAKYSIDIFDKLIIEDNRGYKLEQGKDIFGNEQFAEQRGGMKSSFKKGLNGTLEYSEGTNRASVRKYGLDKWRYEDSFENEIDFSEATWQRLMQRYGTDEDIFFVLIDQFFYR
ncbi:hypothetical protein [Sphingobacterium bambusae]|uniref:Uncharacterized protein n=1 Tax=Sphingobacterium bambusae TaxID=662858 RepID=A0ABW6BLM3_9SPHI|nr:hypothetical protein [Sphingobacterium bambusae]WPL49931.1 hypothetical protein SCB77_05610 [Sphingobacterium bambusae]